MKIMNSKARKIIVSLLICITLIFLIIQYGFLGVFWLTTPKDGEMTKREKEVFEKVKKLTNAKEVWREPKYHISSPKKPASYRIIVNDIQCNNDSARLKNEAQTIFKNSAELHLHENFTKIEVFFQCNEGNDILFSFNR